MFRFAVLFAVAIFLPATFSVGAWAESKWEIVGSSKDKNESRYVDVNSIHRDGDHVYFWILTDFATPPPELASAGVKGFTYHIQGDCLSLGHKYLEILAFPLQMGKGESKKLPVSDHLNSWNYAVPDSMQHKAVKSMCNFTKNKK